MSNLLTPLPQHRDLADWLRREEKEEWRWFADKEKAATDKEQVRLSLLRDTYRMDAEAMRALHDTLCQSNSSLPLA